MARIECLDGLRGIAALWVLVGHCMILTGFFLPILGQPDLGVDLFIYLSGFLMVFQYDLRKSREDWRKPDVWMGFWVRRFFRLSPVYFLLLTVALLAGRAMYADRVLIDTFVGAPLQMPERYIDASAANFLMHLTYAFGLVPGYSYRTPLPDWSLGLEMQFYAAFPFVVLFARRIGWLAAASCVAMLAVGAVVALKAMQIAFPMPSFLALKMHMFLAGMLIAAAGKQKVPYLLLAMGLAAIPIGGQRDVLHLVVRELLLIIVFGLIHWRSTSLFDRASAVLGSPPFHWLGELSYGVYLIHLLILHAVAAWAIARWGHGISSAVRFLPCFRDRGACRLCRCVRNVFAARTAGPEARKEAARHVFPAPACGANAGGGDRCPLISR
ncbi:acyltransferase family protein [Sphingomonas crusticola]|uniref:acyltransferase family protein n=1 Tax=Sphingomonas crusticola TaxID=1697973 RepID=UPI001F0804F1|nr:acyltransferase [Sphingomonas crusticola]